MSDSFPSLPVMRNYRIGAQGPYLGHLVVINTGSLGVGENFIESLLAGQETSRTLSS